MKTNIHALLLPAVMTLGLAVDALGRSGPEHRALRGLSMGNAFVAVVDDKDALHYNPAGLNLINALGNASERPAVASYPRNRMDLRFNAVGMALPLQDMGDFFTFFREHQDSFFDAEEFRSDSTFFRDMAPFDRRPVEIGVLHGAEFAMHNFGFGYWADARAAPYVDAGILAPQAGIERVELDAVIQVAGARGLMNNRLAVGVGYRLASRQTVTKFRVAAAEFATGGGEGVIDTVQELGFEKLSDLRDFSTYGHGIDLGALWQQTSWLRFGASVQNAFMRLDDEFVTPEVTVGAAVTPPLLSTGGVFARKVNLAVDMEDLFNDERGYRPLSKLNFGAEIEQHLWLTASVRVAGGFKGGYWTSGAGLSLFNLLHVEAASWAEEAGYYTGHIEDRHYALNVGVGI